MLSRYQNLGWFRLNNFDLCIWHFWVGGSLRPYYTFVVRLGYSRLSMNWARSRVFHDLSDNVRGIRRVLEVSLMIQNLRWDLSSGHFYWGYLSNHGAKLSWRNIAHYAFL